MRRIFFLATCTALRLMAMDNHPKDISADTASQPAIILNDDDSTIVWVQNSHLEIGDSVESEKCIKIETNILIQECIFRPNNKQIAILGAQEEKGSYFYVVKLFDTVTGKEIAHYTRSKEPGGKFKGVPNGFFKFDPQGEKLLVAKSDCIILLNVGENLEEAFSFADFSMPMLECAFSPDGSRLTLITRDINSGWKKTILPSSSLSNLGLSGDLKNVISVYDLTKEGKQISRFRKSFEPR